MTDTHRNYRIVGLLPHSDHFTVEIEVDGIRHDSGERPSTFGDWGLSRAERAILNRGITASGSDRSPNGRRKKG